MVEFLNLPTSENQKRMADAMERLADGKAPITDYTNAPGAKALVAGTRENGFYGFVQAQDMGLLTDNPEGSQDMSSANLALAVGLAQGAAINQDTPWMKFSRNGEILFVPVKPLCHTVSWNSIYNQGAVYGDNSVGVNPPNGRAGKTVSVKDNAFVIEQIDDHWLRGSAPIAAVGDTIVARGFTNGENNGSFTVESITNYEITVNKTLVNEVGKNSHSVHNKKHEVRQDCEVTIGDNRYKVQLLKSAASDPLDSYDNADRGMVGPNSEWNSLVLPTHEHAELQDWLHKAYAGTTEDWGIGLTDRDLVTHHTFGPGSYRWCQETGDTFPARRVIRGGYGASGGTVAYSWSADSSRGWAPALRLINQ